MNIELQMRYGSTAVERIITPEMQQRAAEALDALVQVLALKLLRDLQALRALQGLGGPMAAPVAPAEPAEGWVLVPKRMTQEMRDVTDSEGWTWEDLLAEAGSISQEEYAAIAAAPVAPTEWTDAKLRGIASDYFPDRAHWPAAMLCLRHLLMEQSKFGAPVAPADDNCTGCNGLGHLPDRGEYESTYLIDGQYRVRCMGCGGTGKLPNLPTLKAAPVAPANNDEPQPEDLRTLCKHCGLYVEKPCKWLPLTPHPNPCPQSRAVLEGYQK